MSVISQISKLPSYAQGPLFRIGQETMPLLDAIDGNSVVKSLPLAAFPYEQSVWQLPGSDLFLTIGRPSEEMECAGCLTVADANDKLVPTLAMAVQLSKLEAISTVRLTAPMGFEFTDAARAILQYRAPADIEAAQSSLAETAGKAFFTVLRTLVLMGSKNLIENVVIPAPEKLNKKRARSGKAPLPSFTQISLSPTARSAFSGTSTGATKCLHAVRSHLRTLPNGRFTIVKPHLRGSGPLKPTKYKVTP